MQLATIDQKLEYVENRFRKGSKGYQAVRYIVRKNRVIHKEEKNAICEEIPIKEKTLQGVFTKLRKMDLYPPQETLESPYQSRAPFQSDRPRMTDIWDKKPKGTTYILMLKEDHDEWLAKLKANYENRLAEQKANYENQLAEQKADNDDLKVDAEIARKTVNFKRYREYLMGHVKRGSHVIIWKSVLDEYRDKAKMYDRLDYSRKLESFKMPIEELTLVPRKYISELNSKISESGRYKGQIGAVRTLISHSGTRRDPISKAFLKDLCKAVDLNYESIEKLPTYYRT